MNYPISEKYTDPKFQTMMMGPNPLKLQEELLRGHGLPAGARVLDLGSGQGLTSAVLAKEYGFHVYAADLWSDPEDNRRFFASLGLTDAQIEPVRADATSLPFERDFFDAVVCTDAYNYFGRDAAFLDEKLLPFVRRGGRVFIAVPGMKKDLHDALPPALLLSWTPEQLDYIHDAAYWRALFSQAAGAGIGRVEEMQINEEAWADWVACDNDYARGDKKSIDAGACRYLNFIAAELRRR
ncbi:MAG: methyltransferase domain-containing protein [Oscillospiraceae bacterium]|nr:methyltransferase domain-containing protein [Oscillospiraceae bacterium]